MESAEPALEATEPVIASLPCDDTDKLDIDTLRVRLLATSEILEQAREDAIASRSQLVRFQRQHQNYVEKHDMQLQTLTRENELLRQQLRKYVTAVQMLRRNSDSTTVESEEEATLDYHREAQQYQHKLVQVAEMHAELMEFNARLTVQLTNKFVWFSCCFKIVANNFAKFLLIYCIMNCFQRTTNQNVAIRIGMSPRSIE